MRYIGIAVIVKVGCYRLAYIYSVPGPYKSPFSVGFFRVRNPPFSRTAFVRYVGSPISIIVCSDWMAVIETIVRLVKIPPSEIITRIVNAPSLICHAALVG
jgi:hypothetical protein